MTSSPSLRTITDALMELDAALTTKTNTAPRSQLRAVVKLLSESGCTSVAELTEALRKKKRKTQSTTAIRQDVVAKHLTALQAANLPPDGFERALSALKNDKKAREEEVNAIGKAFTGGKARFKNKQEGYDILWEKYKERWKAQQYRQRTG